MKMDTILSDNSRIFTIVYDTLAKNLFGYANIVNPLRQEQIAKDLAIKIEKDRDALKEKDPAAQVFSTDKNNEYVLSYKSLQAVIMYRIANYIYNFDDSDFDYSNELKCFFQTQARTLSEKTKVDTSVEIHPAATIGERFVIDHGCATVIGETCEIGHNCYILFGVNLGASEFGKFSRVETAEIVNAPKKRRHPKLGNNVQIGGFARLFGNIEIGDSTVINGYTVVDRDIPANKVVSVVNQIQLCHPNTSTEKIVIYGLRPCNNGLEIIGRNLNTCTKINLLKSGNEENKIEYFGTTIENQSDTSLSFLISDVENLINDPEIKSYKISVNYNEGNILLANSVGWNDFVNNKKTKK